MKKVEVRLEALREYFKTHTTTKALFITEDGDKFYTDLDEFSYLLKYGARTPDGRRIVAHPHPTEHIDDLSLSLYQMIDEAIEAGRLELPELESDEVGGGKLAPEK